MFDAKGGVLEEDKGRTPDKANNDKILDVCKAPTSLENL